MPRLRVLACLASLYLSALLLCSSCSPYVLEDDVHQDRLDQATPPMDGVHSLTQSFTCERPFLSEIELLPAVYAPEGSGSICLVLWSVDEQAIVSQVFAVGDITANQPLRLTFPAQPDSAGRVYRLEVEGSSGVQVGFWSTSYNSLDGGELEIDRRPASGDLRLIVRCRYTAGTMLWQTVRSWLPRIGLLVPFMLLLVVPGLVLGKLLSPTWDDPLLDWGVRTLLSLALVPVVLLWTSLLGLQWRRESCLVIYSLLAIIALAAEARVRFCSIRRLFVRRHRFATAALASILFIILLLRLAQVRNLALPAWVDSPQHVLITQLLTQQGAVPASYEPLLPVQHFYYHYGFHAVTAAFAWLSGLAIPDAMLLLGQVISVLCSLGAYALGAYLFNRRLAGLVAALLAGLVSYLPAYYVSWGRYTQLAGMALLPVAMMCAIEWLRSQRRSVPLLVLAILLNAGMFLIHARVAVFGACVLAAYLLVESIARFHTVPGSSVKGLWLRAAELLAWSLLLCSPWLVRLTRTLPAALSESVSSAADAAYNAVPTGLLLIRNNKQLFVIAALGVLLGLRHFRREVSTILLACLLVGVTVNPAWLGLPGTNLLNNASAVIALFLPLSVLGGLAFSELTVQLPRLLAHAGPRKSTPKRREFVLGCALFVAVTIYSLSSAWGMVSVVNPDTVLATAADLRAMQWIRSALPADSIFLINTRYWQLDMYVGTDGGYWIQSLTGTRTLLPPLPYVFGQPQYVQHTADLARTVAELKDVDSPEFLELLRREGVTHAYVGAKGGPLQPQMFLASQSYRTVYESGAVWIFEVLH